MGNSAFWRDLADQFLALQDRLRAGGEPTAFIYKEFNILAGRGAREISSASAAETTPDLFAVWFHALKEKEEDLAFPSSSQSNEVLSVDEIAQKREMRYVDNMCEVSAIFCKELEEKALQAEFEKKRRNFAETPSTTKAEPQSAKHQAYYLYALPPGQSGLSSNSVFYKVRGEQLANTLCRLFSKEYTSESRGPGFFVKSADEVEQDEQVLLNEALPWLEVYDEPDHTAYDPPPSKEIMALAEYARRARSWEGTILARTGHQANSSIDEPFVQKPLHGALCPDCTLQVLASPEERSLVPNHLSDSAVEQFLKELLATKALIKAEAEKIWNGCSNAHRMISVAANDEKRRVFSEQYEKWRDQLIELQETLIIDRLLPLVAKYEIFSNEQKWLLQACHEVWRPVTAGYLDWVTFAVRGHIHGIETGAIPEWAWQLPGGPRDVARMDLTAEKKASAHFRGVVDMLQSDLALYREGAIAKAFLMRNTHESPIVDSGMRVLEPEADHGPVTIQADRGNRSRVGLPRTHSASLSVFEATVGKLMVQARKECPTKYLPLREISKIATLLDNQNLPLRENLEHAAARTLAEHNKQHPRAAIKTWQTALNYPGFRGAVRKRFWRAEDKCKKATPSIADPSAGTPRTTI